MILPTNKLRFVEREIIVPIGQDLQGNSYFARREKVKILQQFWDYEDNGWLQPDGEWRDVPLEVEK